MPDRKLVHKIIIISVKVLVSALFVLIVLSIFSLEMTKKPQKEIDAILRKHRENIMAIIARRHDGENTLIGSKSYWPPRMNQAYPDIELFDQNGRFFKLSDLKGYILVVSYVDMSSPISQAQAGSATFGAYGVTDSVYKNVRPFSQVVSKNAPDNFTLPNNNVLEVYILVYTQDGSLPTLNDATKWSQHFKLDLEHGIMVAVPKNDMRNSDTQNIITGYQLIDSNMMLRVDSAGMNAKHSLKMTLIPMLYKLVKAKTVGY